ncbi:hypothetical protein KP509_11G061400 [Ceratopteris richardii]|uniref:Exostosin GT47 domain-containing protein n=1 Tax=Ceratopteris richardii TaxID=49495 RepID=A0A8T2TVX3_CERRI|nr:hypothetical protein KP509_11G061400 [Ceratopteris richardii]
MRFSCLQYSFLIGGILIVVFCYSNVSLIFCPLILINSYGAKNPRPNSFPGCNMDTCFNTSRCAEMEDFRIYVYGWPYRSVFYLEAVKSSQWATSNPSEACIFLVVMPLNFSLLMLNPHPSILPHWNDGLNHVIVSLSDSWTQTGPRPVTIGKASIMASSLHMTEYRRGFDISIPLPGKVKCPHLQTLKPWERKYFITFKGTRYIGEREGSFRSSSQFRSLHNGDDAIVAVTCRHETNDKIRWWHPEEGAGCDEDEATFQKYDFRDLMNTTFGLAPAGRSPSSYRLLEILSAGAIPVLIADNYVKPFEGMIQWNRCLMEFSTSEIEKILSKLRRIQRAEMQSRQRYCLFVYQQYLKDDVTIASSLVQMLYRRFNGTLSKYKSALSNAKIK